MKFYAGTADDEEAEFPYGICIARGFTEAVRGGHFYYGSLEIRIVHHIDESRGDEHSRAVRKTQMALVSLATPAHDSALELVVEGVAPQETRQAPGSQVFADIIPLTMGVRDLNPANDDAIEGRTEAAFAEYLTTATA